MGNGPAELPPNVVQVLLAFDTQNRAGRRPAVIEGPQFSGSEDGLRRGIRNSLGIPRIELNKSDPAYLVLVQGCKVDAYPIIEDFGRRKIGVTACPPMSS